MIGQRFTVAKRRVAMFCVALCMALSAQMTIVVLDRLKHTFQIAHAPSELAGPVFDHGHHLRVDVQLASAHSHDDADPAATHAHDHDTAPVHSHAVQDSTDVVHGHDHDMVPHAHADLAHAHDHDTAPLEGFHTHDWLPQGHDHGPIGHHHHGSGMLTPWLVSAPPQLAVLPARIAVVDYGVIGHPDAPAWRRDRPPKLNLERIV